MAQNGQERLPEIEECLEMMLQELGLGGECQRPVQVVPLEEACGCVLAESVY